MAFSYPLKDQSRSKKQVTKLQGQHCFHNNLNISCWKKSAIQVQKIIRAGGNSDFFSWGCGTPFANICRALRERWRAPLKTAFPQLQKELSEVWIASWADSVRSAMRSCLMLLHNSDRLSALNFLMMLS